MNSDIRERARAHVNGLPQCAEDCDGDLVGLEHESHCPLFGKKELGTLDLMVAFAESEAALARKQERLELKNALCKICRNGGRVIKAENGLWYHDDNQSKCPAWMIHERNLAETGG